MKNISFAKISFLFFFVVSALCLCSQISFAENSDSKKNVSVSQLPGQKVVVYYFYGKRRCYTCKKIEALTKETVNNNYMDELKNGLLEFKGIDIDKPENKHYAKDYKLYTKSVVLSEISGGKESRWKNLDQIWQKIQDEKSYAQYIKSETDKYLKEL